MPEERIKTVIGRILEPLEVDMLRIEVFKIDDLTYRANISSSDSSLLIGRHGDNLTALQNIVSVLVNSELENTIKLLLDIEDYKKKQEDNVIDMAKRKALRVLKSGLPEMMPPMNPYYRKLVHMFFANSKDFKTIRTESEGEGSRRQLKIFLVS